MEKTTAVAVCLDHQSVARKALGTLRRRGVCAYVEAEELLSVGCLAVLEAGCTDEALAVVVARRAMIKAVDRNRVRQDGRVWVNRDGATPERNGEEMSDDELLDAELHQSQNSRPENIHVDLWESLRALPTQEYRAVSLYFWGKNTLAEIAEEMGISFQRVSQIIASAKKNLRGSLEISEPHRITKVRGKETQRTVLSGRTEQA